jgi:hypothetical protein
MFDMLHNSFEFLKVYTRPEDVPVLIAFGFILCVILFAFIMFGSKVDKERE